MSIRDHWDGENKVLFVTLEGEITDEDLLKYARRATQDEEVQAGHDELIDLRAETSSVQSHTLRRVADLFAQQDRTPELSRVAIVAADDVAYGLSRMYQAFRSGSPLDLRVFRGMDEARAWLGLEPD